MLKAFCDNCGGPCNAGVTARRFEAIKKNKQYVKLGLEIIPLFDQVSSGTNHICDECLPILLLDVFKGFENSDAVAKYMANNGNATNYSKLRARLEAQLKAANTREGEAKQRIEEAEKVVKKATTQAAADAEKIKVLEAQVKSLTGRHQTALRQQAAADAQAAIDSVAMPEYAINVNRRERQRIRA